MKTTRTMRQTPNRIYSEFPENDNRGTEDFGSLESERRFLQQLNQTFPYSQLIEDCGDMEAVIFSFLPLSSQLALSRTDKRTCARHKKLRIPLDAFLSDCAQNTGAINHSDGHNLMAWFVSIYSRPEGLDGCIAYVASSIRTGNYSAFSKCLNFGRESRLWMGGVGSAQDQILFAAGQGGQDSVHFVLNSTTLAKADSKNYNGCLKTMQEGAASQGDWDTVTSLARLGNQITETVIDFATEHGRLEILAKIWGSLFSNSKAVDGIPLSISKVTIDNTVRTSIALKMAQKAAKAKQIGVLDWMKAFGMESDLRDLENLGKILNVGGTEVFNWFETSYGPNAVAEEKVIWNIAEDKAAAFYGSLFTEAGVHVLEFLHDRMSRVQRETFYKFIFRHALSNGLGKEQPKVRKFLDQIKVPMLQAARAEVATLPAKISRDSVSKGFLHWLGSNVDEINLYTQNVQLSKNLIYFGGRFHVAPLPLPTNDAKLLDSLIDSVSSYADVLEILQAYHSTPTTTLPTLAKDLINKFLEKNLLTYDLGPVLAYLRSVLPEDQQTPQIFESLFGEKYWNLNPELLISTWELAIGLGFANPTPDLIANFLTKYFSFKNLRKKQLSTVMDFSNTLLGWLSGFHSNDLPKDSLIILCLADLVNVAISRLDVAPLIPKLVTLMEMGVELNPKSLLSALRTIPAFGPSFADAAGLTLLETFKQLTFTFEPLALSFEDEGIFFAAYSKSVLKQLCTPAVLMSRKRAFGLSTDDFSDYAMDISK